eukprot:6568177-Prymnesium_polylepis.1
MDHLHAISMPFSPRTAPGCNPRCVEQARGLRGPREAMPCRFLEGVHCTALRCVLLREATKPLHSALHYGCALVPGGDVSGSVRRMCVVHGSIHLRVRPRPPRAARQCTAGLPSNTVERTTN